jgi:anti-sigma regulatory factor (Ser/Thr protein kinase)
MSGADHQAASPLRTSYPGDHGVIGVVRRDLGEWFTAQGFPPEAVERARLVVSELATNAIEAAPGANFEVTVRMEGDGVAALAVTNPSAGTRPPPRSAWGPAEPLALRGRGLAIVAALADAITVSDDDLATITVEARISDQRAGSRRPLQQEGWL